MSRFQVNLQGVEGKATSRDKPQVCSLPQAQPLLPTRVPVLPGAFAAWSRSVGPTGAKGEKQTLSALLNLI